MPSTQTLAVVLAGGRGSRMDVLTRERAKPALPLAGAFQLVDVPMSNLRHSGIEDVWLVVQYQARMLEDFAANGRAWDLDRTHGGFRVLPPQQGGAADSDGFANGNADQLHLLRDEIRDSGATELLVLSADHVYSLDYREVLQTHRAKKAGCTVVTVELGPEREHEARHHTTVVANRLGRVTAVADKPEEPDTAVVATEVFVHDVETLLEVLAEIAVELQGPDAPEPGAVEGLGDVGEHLLPRLVQRRALYEHRHTGYWRDLGRPSSYLAAHRELAADDQGVLRRPGWPLLTRQVHNAPPRLRATARAEDALLGDGSDIRGRVVRSVVGPGCLVAEGALVEDAVLLGDVVVEEGAEVRWALVDGGTRVGAGARIGEVPRDVDRPDDEEITMVGADCVVPAGSQVRAGGRLEPGTTVAADEPRPDVG